MSNILSKNILATVIYYDGLDYPLTSFEVWKHMVRTDYYASPQQQLQVSFSHVIQQLNDESLAKYIEHSSGFYFLRGREGLVSKRISGTKIAATKLKRLRGVVWWLRFVPFVRMVAVTGRLAMKNARSRSDWDILVVLKQGKIWTGRTFVTAILHIIKKRRHGAKVADRICLNHFITEQSLEVITKDLFSASEYMFLFPVFGWDVFKRFQIKNGWIAAIKPSYALGEICPTKTIRDTRISKNIRLAGEFVFSGQWIEQWLKKIEKKKIMNNPKTHKEGSLVYANDDALVFLPNPHGPHVFEQFKEKINKLKV